MSEDDINAMKHQVTLANEVQKIMRWADHDPFDKIPRTSILLSALDVARLLRFDDDFPDDAKAQREAVMRLHRSGKLHGIKGIGKTVKFTPADVRAFVAEIFNKTQEN